MGLKSREWFFGECYKQVTKTKKSPLHFLADKALRLGFKQQMTGGHILQTCGAAQQFLQKYPQHKHTIRQAAANSPYRLKGQILSDWLKFMGTKAGSSTYGKKQFQYNWKSLRTYLTPKYGGLHKGGGGGNDKLEIVIRLVAEF